MPSSSSPPAAKAPRTTPDKGKAPAFERRTPSTSTGTPPPELHVNGSPVRTGTPRSARSVATGGSASDDSTASGWGSNFWVTLVDPQTQVSFFACPATGEVSWDPPVGNFVLPANDAGEWWEIMDETSGIPYYYHTKTGETVWEKPAGFVIPLSVLQNTALGRRLSKRLSATEPDAARRTASTSSSSSHKQRQARRAPAEQRRTHSDHHHQHHHSNRLPPIPGSDASAPSSRAPSRNSERVSVREGAGQRRSGELRRPAQERKASSHSVHTNASTTGNGERANGEHTPPKQRASGNGAGEHTPPKSGQTFKPSRTPPQSLNAAVELITQTQASSTPVGKAASDGPAQDKIDAMHGTGAASSVVAARDKKSTSSWGASTAPSKTSTASAFDAAPPTPVDGSFKSDAAVRLDLNLDLGPPLTFDVNVSAPRSPSTPGRPPVTVHGKAISGPIPNAEATHNMTPVRKRAEGRPILVERSAHPAASVATLRSGATAHPALPEDLASDIQQFAHSDFARQYFSTHRTGVFFKRAVPVEQMMAWQRAPLSTPLLNLPRALHRDALKAFRVVQRVMGDTERAGRAVGRLPDPTAAASGPRDTATLALLEEERWLLSLGITHGELRDEIYCQVMKQIISNPSPESTFKGWQLLCVLVITFPPSKDFEAYLHGFLRQRAGVTEGRVDIMAKHCANRLAVIAKKGPRGKPPTVAEIETAADAAFNPSTFGESLDAVCRLQERTYPHAQIPIVLPFLADGILALGGAKAEGVFRVPGDGDAVAELRTRIDRGFYTLAGVDDPHVLASLFKLWLRELRDPLVPDEMYNECVAYAADPDACVGVVERLPTLNRRVVLFVVSFLQLFLDERTLACTKMTSANLALVMAPNLLRCSSESMAVVFTNAQYEQTFVHNLLLHLRCDQVDPDYVPKHGLGAVPPPAAPRNSRSSARRR